MATTWTACGTTSWATPRAPSRVSKRRVPTIPTMRTPITTWRPYITTRGEAAGDQRTLEQAEGLYHQCLDRDPDHVDCYRGLAALLVQTRRSQSAFDLLERWALRDPQLADPRIELARLYEESGDKQSAARHLTDALDVDAQSGRAGRRWPICASSKANWRRPCPTISRPTGFTRISRPLPSSGSIGAPAECPAGRCGGRRLAHGEYARQCTAITGRCGSTAACARDPFAQGRHSRCHFAPPSGKLGNRLLARPAPRTG